MIIKKISLENIRSYEKEEVEFETGSTLLSGDIGTGKTSILLAIEFGLFGLQPGQRGSSLLRNGEEFGKVELKLEIEGKEIIIERTLKRGKTISQDYSAITIDGEKKEMSITELKANVLELLNYPAEFSKKQNILYKFTVYTPQEEMKQIILQDAESRLNTLRHIFGIDKYKKVLENIGIVRLKIREEKRLFEGITSNLDSDYELLEKKEKEILEKEKTLEELEKNLEIKKKERKIKEEEKNKISKIIEGKSELKSKLGQANGLLYSKKELFDEIQKDIFELEKEIFQFKKLDFQIEKLQEKEEEIFSKKKEREKILEKDKELNSKITALEIKLNECEKLKIKMQNLEVCPTCYQNVDAVYRANVLNKNYNEISKIKNELEELNFDKKNFSEILKKLDIEINLLEKKLTDLKILKMKAEGIEEKKVELEKSFEKKKSIEQDISLLQKQIERNKKDLFELSKYDNIYEEKVTDLNLALREERIADIKFAESKKEIELLQKNILELKDRIKKIEEVKDKLDYFTELEGWINKKFIPLISFVEKNVMLSLKNEFSNIFSKWFNILVPENFNVRISDDFTPIVEQQDYELDYAYLSGGERTAIALAYRLAITHIINSVMSKIKTKDLVILDEPTDGFSSKQLDKVREVFEQLKVKQLIIVSHEQKIESFVENVIKLGKEYGSSKKI